MQISINLPSSIPLRVLHLRLSCDNVSKLAQNLEEISIVVSADSGFDSCLVSLSACLGQLGKCMTAGSPVVGQFAISFAAGHLGEPIRWPCKCGACQKCLPELQECVTSVLLAPFAPLKWH